MQSIGSPISLLLQSTVIELAFSPVEKSTDEKSSNGGGKGTEFSGSGNGKPPSTGPIML